MRSSDLFGFVTPWDLDAPFEPTHEEMPPPEREAAIALRRRTEMAQRLGVADDRLVGDLAGVGYGPDTIALLEIAPLVEIAWADDRVSGAERGVIADIALAQAGCASGSIGDQQITVWLLTRPSARFFRVSLTALRALLRSVGPKPRLEVRGRLQRHCTQVAAASRGRLGLGRRISARERCALARIAARLEITEREARRRPASEELAEREAMN